MKQRKERKWGRKGKLMGSALGVLLNDYALYKSTHSLTHGQGEGVGHLQQDERDLFMGCIIAR